MDNILNEEKLNEQLEMNKSEAEELLADQDRMEEFLKRMEEKLDQVPVLGEKIAEVPVLISLIRAYVRKEYREIPVGRIILIVSAFIYLPSPQDLIPDRIPILGLADDILVIIIVWKNVADDVEKYKEWHDAKHVKE